MKGRSVLVAIAVSGAVAVPGAIACSSFTAEPTTGVDGGPPAGDADVDNELAPLCPPSGEKAAVLTETILALPPSNEHEYPFGIATDRTSVYWVAQHAPVGADPVEPYNGKSDGRIRRVRKDAKLADAASTLLVENQAHALGVALDGDFLYWATDEGSNKILIRRVARDCSAPCAPTEEYSGGGFTGILGMKRAAPGVLFLQSKDGKGYLFDTTSKSVQLIGGGGNNPGFALRPNDVFLANSETAEVKRISFDGVGSFTPSTFNTFADGKGAGPLTTDCTTIYASRDDTKTLWSGLATSGNLTLWVTLTIDAQPIDDVFDLAADAKNVYVAQANTGGVYAIDKKTKAIKRLHSGNIWRIAVDDDGIYGGEHGQTTGGALFRLH